MRLKCINQINFSLLCSIAHMKQALNIDWRRFYVLFVVWRYIQHRYAQIIPRGSRDMGSWKICCNSCRGLLCRRPSSRNGPVFVRQGMRNNQTLPMRPKLCLFFATDSTIHTIHEHTVVVPQIYHRSKHYRVVRQAAATTPDIPPRALAGYDKRRMSQHLVCFSRLSLLG